MSVFVLEVWDGDHFHVVGFTFDEDKAYKWKNENQYDRHVTQWIEEYVFSN